MRSFMFRMTIGRRNIRKMKEVKQNNKRKYLIYGLFGLILLGVLFGGFKGGKYKADKFWEREIKQKDSITQASLKREEDLNRVLDTLRMNDTEDEIVQYNYYWDYIREKKENERLNEKFKEVLDAIRTRSYDREYLDSLSGNIRFN